MFLILAHADCSKKPKNNHMNLIVLADFIPLETNNIFPPSAIKISFTFHTQPVKMSFRVLALSSKLWEDAFCLFSLLQALLCSSLPFHHLTETQPAISSCVPNRCETNCNLHNNSCINEDADLQQRSAQAYCKYIIFLYRSSLYSCKCNFPSRKVSMLRVCISQSHTDLSRQTLLLKENISSL